MDWDIENGYIGTTAHNGRAVLPDTICGIDEAGRGPLACAVYAAAVILPHGLDIPYLNDSKKVSEKRRESIFEIIREKSIAYAVCKAEVDEIDKYNILNASQLAMRRAAEQIKDFMTLILIDGHIARGFTIPAKCVIRGDERSPNIAAASIMAKVERDRFMRKMDEIYPEYGFARHKGYPTREHIENIFKYGRTPLHRTSFLTNLALKAGREIREYGE